MVREISLKAAPRIQLGESGESERGDCGDICKCSEYIGVVVGFDDAWSLRSEKETNLRSIFLSCRTAHFVPFPFGLFGVVVGWSKWACKWGAVESSAWA